MRRPSPRILYVDDDPELRLCVEQILTRAGHDVTMAASAGEALACLGEHRYDLVIADQWMPGETGTELLEHARRLGLMRRTHAAVVTNDVSTAETTVGIHLKPTSESALLCYVAQRLRPTRTSHLRGICAFAAGIALALASLAGLEVVVRDHAGQARA